MKLKKEKYIQSRLEKKCEKVVRGGKGQREKVVSERKGNIFRAMEQGRGGMYQLVLQAKDEEKYIETDLKEKKRENHRTK